jgi:hypothetical protein
MYNCEPEQDMFMATQKILKNYSYALLTIALAICLYSLARIINCSFYGASVYTDLCKLSGLVYFNFYGFPILGLSIMGIALPKLSENDKILKFTLLFLTIVSIRFVYLIITSILR